MASVDVTCVIPTIGRTSLERAVMSAHLQQPYQFAAILIGTDDDRDGPAATRNRILSSVRTEWVAFLDDDDTLLPNHLGNLWEAREGFDVLYPWFYGRAAESLRVPVGGLPSSPFGVRFEEEQATALRRGNFIPVTAMVRTALGEQVGWFPEPSDEVPYEDWGLWLRLLDAGARFRHVPYRTWRYGT